MVFEEHITQIECHMKFIVEQEVTNPQLSSFEDMLLI